MISYSCLNCKRENFRKRVKKPLVGMCDFCPQTYKKNRVKILAKVKARYEVKKDEILAYVTKYRRANRETILSKKAQYRENNREYLRSKAKEYRERVKHTEEFKRRDRINRSKYLSKVQNKLALSLRTRVKIAVKSNAKAGSAVRDLGCTIPELKALLESKFKSGMTWKNWSLHGWHLEHIVPLHKFDLTERTQFLKACHFSNLQPMWATEHYKKSAKELAELFKQRAA